MEDKMEQWSNGMKMNLVKILYICDKEAGQS